MAVARDKFRDIADIHRKAPTATTADVANGGGGAHQRARRHARGPAATCSSAMSVLVFSLAALTATAAWQHTETYKDKLSSSSNYASSSAAGSSSSYASASGSNYASGSSSAGPPPAPPPSSSFDAKWALYVNRTVTNAARGLQASKMDAGGVCVCVCEGD